MALSRKDKIRKLLKGIETGDPDAAAVVSSERYIQHNPQTREGGEGLAALFKRLSKTSPRVNLVRVFEDQDFVFAHTEYDFATRKIGFEVFRYDGDHVVEHWDNIQERRGPNPSGRSMVDGPTEAVDHALTETNRALVASFVERVLIGGQTDRLDEYIGGESFAQHNPGMLDGKTNLRSALTARDGERDVIRYERVHRVLAEGSFVLSACEGQHHGQHTAFYDLYRIHEGQLVEHWDTVEEIPPPAEWKNSNGKF